jgi:predicted TIM-barrel fold metal-dependent hydrolase
MMLDGIGMTIAQRDAAWREIERLKAELRKQGVSVEPSVRRFDAEEAAAESHLGFDIQCCQCGGSIVSVQSNVGHSPQSGSWGGVQLHCHGCQQETEIWSATS